MSRDPCRRRYAVQWRIARMSGPKTSTPPQRGRPTSKALTAISVSSVPLCLRVKGLSAAVEVRAPLEYPREKARAGTEFEDAPIRRPHSDTHRNVVSNLGPPGAPRSAASSCRACIVLIPAPCGCRPEYPRRVSFGSRSCSSRDWGLIIVASADRVHNLLKKNRAASDGTLARGNRAAARSRKDPQRAERPAQGLRQRSRVRPASS